MKSAAALDRLKQIVIERTGHAYYVDKDKLLIERARERMKVHGITALDDYVELLETSSEAEWRALEDVITVGETYFFRYPDHFEMLRREILPSLIERNRVSRTLRIWSIGCSTGPEPYSIAILLRELLGDDVDTWRIGLVGGDISERVLAAARTGRYSAWALRTLGPEDRARYFDRDGSVWALKAIYRAMVRFERQNILELLSPTPPLAWNGFDLILCRNVLIYFSPAQAVTIINQLGNRLAEGGALILGHAEATLAVDPMPLSTFQASTEFGQALKLPIDAPYAPLELPPLPPGLAERLVSATAAPVVPTVACTESEDLDRLQQLADAGAYEAAEQLAQELIARSPTSARLQYYDAVLRQVSDDLKGAEAALRRALYLDRSFTLAHHRLGLLMLALGRRSEARRSLLAAVKLAEALAPQDLLPEGQGVTAGAFGAVLRAQINAIGEAA